MLQAHQLSYCYALLEPLFQKVTFEIQAGDRVGLVGPNGAGKTTLLRILAGDLAPDSGQVIRARGLRVAWLRQENAALPADAGDPDAHVLHALGLNPEQPFETLSAGQRSRWLLAQCLVSRADLLLLDEPTNHLDAKARDWLARELSRFRGAAVLVSHDRAFLDQATNRTFEIRRGAFREYGGGYAFYEQASAMREDQEWEAFRRKQQLAAAAERAAAKRDRLAAKVAAPPPGVRHSQDFYARKAAKVARTGRVLRQRMQTPELAAIAKPWEEQPMPALDFSAVPRSGAMPVELAAVTKRYDETVVLRDLSWRVLRGERWQIAGPNGSGKTTLFRLLLGREQAEAGEVRIGWNVRFGYFAQEAENLDPRLTPVEACEGADPTWVRTLLACLKLPRALADQKIGSLSLGERAKAALVRVLVSQANVVLLDEPTNHLEIEAQVALEQTLRQFPGTVLLVSHDRRFAESVTDRRLDLPA